MDITNIHAPHDPSHSLSRGLKRPRQVVEVANTANTAEEPNRQPSKKHVNFSIQTSPHDTRASDPHSSSCPPPLQQPSAQLQQTLITKTVSQDAPAMLETLRSEQVTHQRSEPEQLVKQQSTDLSAHQSPSHHPAPVLTKEQPVSQPSATDLLLSWTNPCLQSKSSSNIADLPSLCGAAARCIMPTSINRADLQQGIAMRQFENKFIALVCNGVLCIADQHAADERVQLEKLKAAVSNNKVLLQ